VGHPLDQPSFQHGRTPTHPHPDGSVVDFPLGNTPFAGTSLRTNFFVRWTGVFRLERAARLPFELESDDGSRLLIDGRTIIDFDGLHPMAPRRHRRPDGGGAPD